MKTKNIVIFTAIIPLAFVGIIFLSKGDNGGRDLNPPTQSASILSAFEKNFDFGTIAMKNGDVSKTFELKNEGPEPVVISKVYTSCMCTTAKITDAKGKKYGVFGMPGHGGGTSKANIEVGAGETIQVEAIFDPAAHGPSGVGFANRAVFLETNSNQTPKIELNFTAMVTN